MIEVSVRLPEEMLAALKRVASEEDTSVGAIVREALERDFYRRGRAKTSERTDERLVAPLRALLADDFNYAKSWDELALRLRRKGFALREAGGGVVLTALRNGRRLCKGSELGHSLSALTRRFNAAYPSAENPAQDRALAPADPHRTRGTAPAGNRPPAHA